MAHFGRAFWKRLGYRGTALLFFCLFDLVYAYSLGPVTSRDGWPQSQAYLSAIAPIPVFRAMWVAVGLVCAFAAFRTRDWPGFAAAMGIKVLWAGVFIGAVGRIDQVLVNVALWLCQAAFVAVMSRWPEPTLPPFFCPDAASDAVDRGESSGEA